MTFLLPSPCSPFPSAAASEKEASPSTCRQLLNTSMARRDGRRFQLRRKSAHPLGGSIYNTCKPCLGVLGIHNLAGPDLCFSWLWLQVSTLPIPLNEHPHPNPGQCPHCTGIHSFCLMSWRKLKPKLRRTPTTFPITMQHPLREDFPHLSIQDSAGKVQARQLLQGRRVSIGNARTSINLWALPSWALPSMAQGREQLLSVIPSPSPSPGPTVPVQPPQPLSIPLPSTGTEGRIDLLQTELPKGTRPNCDSTQ